jgi:DNA-binding MarR family transcriptional regulator
MDSPDYSSIDDILSSKIRLGIAALLITAEIAEFTYIKEALGLTDGNLSTHLHKMEEAGYVVIIKQFVNNKPKTTVQLSPQGIKAFQAYVNFLESIIKNKR